MVSKALARKMQEILRECKEEREHKAMVFSTWAAESGNAKEADELKFCEELQTSCAQEAGSFIASWAAIENCTLIPRAPAAARKRQAILRDEMRTNQEMVAVWEQRALIYGRMEDQEKRRRYLGVAELLVTIHTDRWRAAEKQIKYWARVERADCCE
jgi:hypothetical protein